MKKLIVGLGVLGWLAALALQAADKKIVFIAGTPSHGPGEHEHRAGCLLFQTCLQNTPGLTTVVYSNGWPADPQAFANAATIVVYADGGGGHPLLQGDHLKTIGALMDQGVGLVCLHYATEPTMEKGEREFLKWIGGAFEINWSVNPHWDAHFQSLPEHPVARGVKPFHILDEWYFNMRFRDGMTGVTPLLSAVPDGSTTNRHDGPHEGNPAMRAMVARGDLQHVAWAAERAGGGRGFGFTGGHFHKNWANDHMRKLVLNAILWTAHVEVPAGGVDSHPTPAQLAANQDEKGPRRPPAPPRAPGAPAPVRR
ncbi:MAG TPA: ThuA domain-containing protein [Verrucomicrobiota bacterium]|nr:ThuA domain-containing protein [Verrucomicrobiota bacterium]HNT13624.1 ThuA domain-containing protein [Verrucomicrobiota bacterium]